MKAKEKEFLEKLADLMLEYDALLGVKKEFITVDVDYFMDDQQTIYIPFDGVLSYRGIKKLLRRTYLKGIRLLLPGYQPATARF